MLEQTVEWRWKNSDAGYTIKGLDVVGIQRSFSINSLIKNFSFPIRLLKSLNAAKKIIESFNPDVVIGVGGMLAVQP